ncbi:hypothetical protein [Teichococcus aestuarii]
MTFRGEELPVEALTEESFEGVGRRCSPPAPASPSATPPPP